MASSLYSTPPISMRAPAPPSTPLPTEERLEAARVAVMYHLPTLEIIMYWQGRIRAPCRNPPSLADQLLNPLDPRALKCAAFDLARFLGVLYEFDYRYGMRSIDDWEHVQDTERYIMEYLSAITDYVGLLFGRETWLDQFEGAEPCEGLDEWSEDDLESLTHWAWVSAVRIAEDMIQRERDDEARILVPLGAIICLEPMRVLSPNVSPPLRSVTPSPQTGPIPASSTVAGEEYNDHSRSMPTRAGSSPRTSGISSEPHPVLAPPAEIYDPPARLPVFRHDIDAVILALPEVPPYAPGRGQPHPDLIVRAGPDLVFDANTPSNSPPTSTIVRVDSVPPSSCPSSSLGTMDVLPPSSPWLFYGTAAHRALETVTRGSLDVPDTLNGRSQTRGFIVRQPHPGQAVQGFQDEWRNQARSRLDEWVRSGVPTNGRYP